MRFYIVDLPRVTQTPSAREGRRNLRGTAELRTFSGDSKIGQHILRHSEKLSYSQMYSSSKPPAAANDEGFKSETASHAKTRIIRDSAIDVQSEEPTIQFPITELHKSVEAIIPELPLVEEAELEQPIPPPRSPRANKIKAIEDEPERPTSPPEQPKSIPRAVERKLPQSPLFSRRTSSLFSPPIAPSSAPASSPTLIPTIIPTDSLCKIMLLGDSGVGKSSLFSQLTRSKFNSGIFIYFSNLIKLHVRPRELILLPIR